MTSRLQGKTAFVTAAGQGIGRAVAEAFVREGARVIATDLNAELLASLQGCQTHRLDVTDRDAIVRAAADSGPVNVLFNGRRLRARRLGARLHRSRLGTSRSA